MHFLVFRFRFDPVFFVSAHKIVFAVYDTKNTITKAYFAMSVSQSEFSSVSHQFRCAESESEIRFPKFNLSRFKEASEICGFLLFLDKRTPPDS
jgi:hypothetical protein